MTLASMKTNLINSGSFFYFLPKKLVREQVLPVIIFSIKKRHLDFEVEPFNFSESQTPFTFSASVENHFSFYDVALFEKQQFLLSYQSFDLASGVKFFSKKKKRVKDSCGLFSVLREKHSFLLNCKRTLLIKARILYLIKGGFVLSCFGNPAILIRDALFSGVQIHKNYRGWFSANLLNYGCLSYFRVFRFERLNLPYFFRLQKEFPANRIKFYNLKNLLFGYLFVLTKPKYIFP